MPRRSLKITWSVRGMTVKWGFAHLLNAYRKVSGLSCTFLFKAGFVLEVPHVAGT